MPTPPVVLSIAGSDAGGGAGIQADLMAIRDGGGFGVTAITAVTAQNTVGVQRVDGLSPDSVMAQIRSVDDDMDLAAIKIGMLGTAAHVHAVAEALDGLRGRPPVVLDPVMVATSGDRLLAEAAEVAIRDLLLPRVTLATPNHPEAMRLAPAAGADASDLAEAWRDLGVAAVLVTGGDAPTEEVIDLLWTARGGRAWRSPRVHGGPFHGTGCTLSSAIAVRLARGEALEDAVDGAIAYVGRRLQTAWAPGRGSRVLGADRT